MSRSSPGRYAIHEFSKNVFEVHAFDGKGKALTIVAAESVPVERHRARRDGPDHLQDLRQSRRRHLPRDRRLARAHEHPGDVHVGARLRHASGSRDLRASQQGTNWKVATQLFPTEDPFTFTAPNFQYFMDSPTEMSDFGLRSLQGEEPGRQGVHDPHRRPSRRPRLGARRVRRRHREDRPRAGGRSSASFRSSMPAPTRSSATTSRGAAATAWSTATAPWSPPRPRSRIRRRRGGALGTVSHEFFHAWNVERIRPKTLEPFNFEEANMSGELWIAEGFTQYYGGLVMGRAGLRAGRPDDCSAWRTPRSASRRIRRGSSDRRWR